MAVGSPGQADPLLLASRQVNTLEEGQRGEQSRAEERREGKRRRGDEIRLLLLLSLMFNVDIAITLDKPDAFVGVF